jgi:hypothetical protein
MKRKLFWTIATLILSVGFVEGLWRQESGQCALYALLTGLFAFFSGFHFADAAKHIDRKHYSLRREKEDDVP